MASLPTNQRDQVLLVVCVALLALGVVYYMYVFSPKSVQLVALESRVDSLRNENEKSRRDVARGTAATLRKEAEEYGRMLVVMRQLIPVANEVPTLLEQISTAARRTGLDVSDVTPLPPIPGEIFDTHRFRLGVTGPFHSIARFLNNVGSLTRIVAPMNLAISTSSRPNVRVRPGEQALDATFEIQTYVAKAPLPAPAPARPGGTD